jgi:N-acetylglucosamine-6-phosphate deacetylase
LTISRLTGTDPITGKGQLITFEKELIVAIEEVEPQPSTYIAPGLVDLQVNGFAGHDLNPGPQGTSTETVVELVRELRAVGVTRFCPTLITASESTLLASLRAIAQACQDPDVGAAISCIHMEGPWISPAEGARGAHPAIHIRDPDVAEFAAWQDASDGRVGIVTLCPARKKALPMISHLTKVAGVHAAIGHTDAEPDLIRAASQAGARLSTHLGNGIPAVLPRHPNVIWAQLADDQLTASFIADGHHLPDDTLKAMIRAKGVERSLLVSDATALGGKPPGRYEVPIGGSVELSENGRLSVAGTPYLAGAVKSLAEGVETAMRLVGLRDAILMATRNPGRFAGGGLLAVGERADIIRFRIKPGSTTLNLIDVVIAGRTL